MPAPKVHVAAELRPTDLGTRTPRLAQNLDRKPRQRRIATDSHPAHHHNPHARQGRSSETSGQVHSEDEGGGEGQGREHHGKDEHQTRLSKAANQPTVLAQVRGAAGRLSGRRLRARVSSVSVTPVSTARQHRQVRRSALHLYARRDMDEDHVAQLDKRGAAVQGRAVVAVMGSSQR
ncbi:hypothetical protein ACIBCO_38930 [Streptomyces violascens]|uniref:hypothetical protein n=1 Tax=Streptomyces violascens TaxID=67381 RepID=UPI0037BBBA47